MAENDNKITGQSPLKKMKISPRKHPYLKPSPQKSAVLATAATATATTGRSPLRDIQKPTGQGQPTQIIQNLKEKSANLNNAIGKILNNKGVVVKTNNENNSKTNNSENNTSTTIKTGISIPFHNLFSFGQGQALFPQQKPLPLPIPQKQPHVTIYTGIDQDEPDDANVGIPVAVIVDKPPKPKDFGAIGEERSKAQRMEVEAQAPTNANASVGFIPVDKSCVIATNENGSLNISSSSIDVELGLDSSGENPAPGWNPFGGVIAQVLQPRGLNSSFTEKFESRLGIHSSNKENRCEDVVAGKLRPLMAASSQVGAARIALSELLATPLFECHEYVYDILKYWSHLEMKFGVKWNYMEKHTGISHKMRTILIDWLVEVAVEYELEEETLHLAVNYIDRFLSRMNVTRNKLQLVGAAALFIAAKFEEMSPPEIQDFVYVTDEAYTKQEILAMESCILTALEFDLMMPTAHSLVLCYSSLLKLPDRARCLALYLADLSLMDGEVFLKYAPSTVAGAAVALARYVQNNTTFVDAELQKYCRHRRKTLAACVRNLYSSFISAPSKQQLSIYEKYQSIRYCSVATTVTLPLTGPWTEKPEKAGTTN